MKFDLIHLSVLERHLTLNEGPMNKVLAAGLGLGMALGSPTAHAETPPQINIHQKIEPRFSIQSAAKFIRLYEGYSKHVYYVYNIPHIGVGFNLTRSGAKKRIEAVGANYNAIRQGTQDLTDKQISQLYYDDLRKAIEIAKDFVSNFDKLPGGVQLIVTDMAFNMGRERLNTFEDFKISLLSKDYSNAAKEMINSRWYDQVKTRSKNLVKMMRNYGI